MVTSKKKTHKTTEPIQENQEQTPMQINNEAARWLHDMLYDYEFVIETARAKGNAHIDFMKDLLDKNQYPEGVTEEMVKEDLQTVYNSIDMITKADTRRKELIAMFQEYLGITQEANVETGVVEGELIEEHVEDIQPVHEVSETDTSVS